MRILKIAILAAVLGMGINASGAEMNQLAISKIKDASITTMPEVCTQTVKVAVIFTKEEPIVCYGVLLKDVIGRNDVGAEVQIGDVLLMPTNTLEDAQNIKKHILASVLNKRIPGTSVGISKLSYYSKEVELSELTKDPNDQNKIKIGGISVSVQIVKKDGNQTLTYSGTEKIGLQ